MLGAPECPKTMIFYLGTFGCQETNKISLDFCKNKHNNKSSASGALGKDKDAKSNKNVQKVVKKSSAASIKAKFLGASSKKPKPGKKESESKVDDTKGNDGPSPKKASRKSSADAVKAKLAAKLAKMKKEKADKIHAAKKRKLSDVNDGDNDVVSGNKKNKRK